MKFKFLPAKGIWVRLFPYLEGSWTPLFFAMVFNTIHGLGVAVQNVAPKYLLDDVLLNKGVTLEDRYHRLLLFGIVYLLASIVGRMLVWHWSYRIFTRVRERVLYEMRARFFRHINSLCMRFHNRYNSGELYSYLFGSPLTQVQAYLQGFAMFVPGAVCTLVITLIWVGLWDIYMTVILGFSVLANVLIMNRSMNHIQILQTNFQTAEGNITGRVADLIRGTREIKMYAAENNVIDDFQVQAKRISQQSVYRDIRSHIQYMKQETCGYVFFVLLCSVGAWRFLEHGLEEGELVAYLTCFTALQDPLQQLFQISMLKGAALASLERIQVVLDTGSTTPDPIGTKLELPRRGAIHFENVTFAYAKKPTFQDFNLEIPYGQRLALVGASGAGKSTLIQLLLRLYDPQSGRIHIDGVAISQCYGAEVRRRFGVVPQAPYFFQGTIRDNLKLVRKEADEALIQDACRRANAWEFIEKLPDGIDTSLAEGGSTLSGGQRQRLAIARVLLYDPSFFIFDEATSALDTISERLIQQALNATIMGRTAIFIAHRLSTIKTCDRIIVLENGKIQQDGSYEKLSQAPGLFRQMLEPADGSPHLLVGSD